MYQNETSYRLQLLVDFIRLRPSLFQIITFLSSNICPFGEITGVSTATLRTDGWIITEFQYGFHELTEFEPVRIEMQAPGAEALRNLQMVIANRRTLHIDFKDTSCDVPSLDNETGIYFPTSPTRLFRFALNGVPEKHEEMRNYYECVRSILILWENLLTVEIEEKKLSPALLGASTRLTNRQEKILELLRHGKTNSEIAEEIGFSESLVKQETILIYKKLGISGRKELLIEERAKV